MAQTGRIVSFEGLLEESVLGTFTVIRGFGDLQDLARVSVSMQYQAQGLGAGVGYQRPLDEAHVEDLKHFMKDGSNRFFTEIVLSLRSRGEVDPIVSFRQKGKSKLYRVRVDMNALAQQENKPIFRIDGNHRLVAAERWVSEEVSSSSAPQNRQAAFCFVVMNSERPVDDELAEAMLFNLINSKALPLVSEHSLSVLMRDDRNLSIRFAEDPEIYLTERLKTRMAGWQQRFYKALGDTPLTRLHATARTLLRDDSISKDGYEKLEAEAEALLDPIYELAVLLKEQHQRFVYSECFLPIAAEVYLRHSVLAGEENLDQRKRRAGHWLREFAEWFDRLDVADLPAQPDSAVLWSIFKKQFDQKTGQVFLAMSFRDSEYLNNIKGRVKEAIEEVNKKHVINIAGPVRIDEQGGASYSIPQRIFKEITQSKLVIADLTDERPNVYLEVGYAMAQGILFILTFHKKTPGEKAPWEQKDKEGNRVHFDLLAYRYVEYEDTTTLRDKLIPELEAFFRQEV